MQTVGYQYMYDSMFPHSHPLFYWLSQEAMFNQKTSRNLFTNDDDQCDSWLLDSHHLQVPFRMITFITFIHLKLIILDMCKNMPSPFLRFYCSIKFGRIVNFGRLQARGVGSICGGRESRLKLRSFAALTVSTSWPFRVFLVMANTPQICCVDCSLVKYVVCSPGLFVHLMYIYIIYIYICIYIYAFQFTLWILI